MGWISKEGSMESFAKGGKVKRTKSQKQRKKEVMEAHLSPRDKFKGTDEEFIKSAMEKRKAKKLARTIAKKSKK